MPKDYVNSCRYMYIIMGKFNSIYSDKYRDPKEEKEIVTTLLSFIVGTIITCVILFILGVISSLFV